MPFQSTPSVGRATSASISAYNPISISIHALRGEGDPFRLWRAAKGCYHFNPRPPWGGRHVLNAHIPAISQFQSTPSVGRATMFSMLIFLQYLNFNPRPPWGGRLLLFEVFHRFFNFNPRPPWGGRPSAHLLYPALLPISIHALRGEGDYFVVIVKGKSGIFQSTPSVGRATTTTLCITWGEKIFQSTPSVGRATS